MIAHARHLMIATQRPIEKKTSEIEHVDTWDTLVSRPVTNWRRFFASLLLKNL